MKPQNNHRIVWLSLTLALAVLTTFFCHNWNRFGAPAMFTRKNASVPLSPAAPKTGDALTAQVGQPGAQIAKKVTATRAFDGLPLYFIENRGQLDARVAYYLQGRETSLYFTHTGLTFALSGATKLQPASFNAAHPPAAVQPWALKLDFVGADPAARPVGQETTPAAISHFDGPRQHWQAGLKTYARIVYRNLWPGIDLVYAGTVNRLKYEFVVNPGANPSRIQLAYRGAAAVEVNPAGQLEIRTPAGGFRDERPLAYQVQDGRRVEVASAYALQTAASGRAQAYGFSLGAYDRNQPLVIDPAVLVYSGLLGSTGNEAGNGITVDSAGNVYVTGTVGSSAASFPAAEGPMQNEGGNSAAFVAKLGADGKSLFYASYLGGKGESAGQAIAVDARGNAYVTGRTAATSFPTINAPQSKLGGGKDAFVAALDATGSKLVYSTYLGGAGTDDVRAVALDASGALYLVGNTEGGLPLAPDSLRPAYGGGAHDAFVMKLRPLAARGADSIVYSTYLGGSGDDLATSLAVDAEGQAYVTGQTSSPDFPLAKAFRSILEGQTEAFVVKLNQAGSALFMRHSLAAQEPTKAAALRWMRQATRI
ncbi:MAG: SBBP repeat-containing protein [Acidobacteria bacterium]|nr:SBBP repeat-containing protein [Acidobacteriota bacterium]MBI3421979.1 SBBP repeat-containing protein [Acidobacteriota bacterium]